MPAKAKKCERKASRSTSVKDEPSFLPTSAAGPSRQKRGLSASGASSTGATVEVCTEGVHLSPEEEQLVSRALAALLDAIDETPPPAGLAPPTQTPQSNDAGGKDDPENAKKQKLMYFLTGMCYGLTPGEERLAMYRALKASRFDIPKAVNALMSTVEFRKRQNLNRMVLFPSLVPTRGYHEQLVCQTLNLPFLEHWQLAATGVAPMPSIPHVAVPAVGEDGRLRLVNGGDLDSYYQASYSDFVCGAEVGRPGELTSQTPSVCDAAFPSSSHGRQTPPQSPLNANGTNAAGHRVHGQNPDSSLSFDGHFESELTALSRGNSKDTRGSLRRHRSRSNAGDPLNEGDDSKSDDDTRSGSGADVSASESRSAHSINSEEDDAPQPQGDHGLLARFLDRINPFGRADPQPADAAGKRAGAGAASATKAKEAGTEHRSFLGGLFGKGADSTCGGTKAEAGGGGGGGSGDVETKEETHGKASHHSRRTSSLHGGGGGGGSGGVVDSAQLVDQQTAAFLNTDGVGRNVVSGSPTTCFSEALDFHALLQPVVNAVIRYLPTCIHYWDRQGHPVLYVKLGPLRARRLVEGLFKLTPVSTEPKALALLYHAYSLEVMTQFIRYNNHKNMRDNAIRSALLADQPPSHTAGSPLLRDKTILPAKEPMSSCVVVIDCAKVRLKKLLHKPLLQIVKPIISLDQKHYSELLHHLYVVNCNSAVNVSYLTIRSVLCEETREKISFCTRRNTAETLKAVIDADVLPSELGGRCQCPGGCIPEYASPSFDDVSVASVTSLSESRNCDVDVSTESLELSETFDSATNGLRPRLNCTVEKIVVPPRKKSTLSFVVAAHEELFWEFRCKNKRSVEFSVVYIPVTADGDIFSLSDPARVKDGASHYICPDAGTVILEWQNKYSKLHSIRIHAKVYLDAYADSLLTPHSGS